MASQVLFEQTSPYGSRVLVVENEADAVFAYLLDPGRDVPFIASLWLLNLAAAPDAIDRDRMNTGRPPLMPRGSTRHPGGASCPAASAWRAEWFEEGDGVGIYADGQLLGVMPGWAGENGFQGYAREAIGQSPLAWSMDDATETLDARLEAANQFWGWRADPSSWPAIQSAVLDHVAAHIGPQEQYWALDGGGFPPIGASRHAWLDVAGVSVTTTVGMSGQPMPGVERYHDDPLPFAHIELAVATAGADDSGARLLSTVSSIPWQRGTWLGDGHTLQSEHPVLQDLGFGGLLFTATADLCNAGPTPPNLAGSNLRPDTPISYLWLFPLTREEVQLAQAQGTPTLIARLRTEHRSWIIV